MKDLEKLQQKFNLFQVGDVVNGSIVTVSEGSAKVKTTGGCYGTIIGKIPDTLVESSAVEVIVSDIKDGLPVFTFTQDFLFDKIKQDATVCFASPHAVIVEFDSRPETYGSYEPSGGMTPELQNLTSGDKVVVSELKTGALCQEYFSIGKLEIKPAEVAVSAVAEIKSDKPEKSDNDMLKPWPKERIEDVFNSGSRKMYGKVSLGKVYTVIPFGKSGKEVQFPDGQVGDLDVYFPKGCPRAMVRVVFINQANRPKAKLIRGEAEPVVHTGITDLTPVREKMKKEIAKDGKNKFRNEEIFRAGLAGGSCYRAGGYWLGYNYKVEVKNGLPYFAPANQDPKNILERARVVVKDGASFNEGDYVCAEVAFIRREGTTHNYTFEVNVLKVF